LIVATCLKKVRTRATEVIKVSGYSKEAVDEHVATKVKSTVT